MSKASQLFLRLLSVVLAAATVLSGTTPALAHLGFADEYATGALDTPILLGVAAIVVLVLYIAYIEKQAETEDENEEL